MFRIFTFRQLAIISFLLCFIMLSGAALNAVAPYVAAFSQSSINVPIIMYHQIYENSYNCGDYIIPLELLRDDFEYIKENNFHPVSFNELSEYVKTGKKLPENPLVITFDDGERSFITKVVPLLEEFSYPANVNVVGSLVELYTKNGEINDRYAYLNENDLKKLSSNPLVEIGCHTYNFHSLNSRRGMTRLKTESDEEYNRLILDDIRLFQEKLYNITGKKAVCFAYPFGLRNDTILKILKDEGFTVTLTCRESTNTLVVGGELYELGRFNRPYGKSSEVFFKSILS